MNNGWISGRLPSKEEADFTGQTAKHGKVTFILNEENFSQKSGNYHRS